MSLGVGDQRLGGVIDDVDIDSYGAADECRRRQDPPELLSSVSWCARTITSGTGPVGRDAGVVDRGVGRVRDDVDQDVEPDPDADRCTGGAR